MAFLQTPKAQFGTIIIDFMLVFFRRMLSRVKMNLRRQSQGKVPLPLNFIAQITFQSASIIRVRLLFSYRLQS